MSSLPKKPEKLSEYLASRAEAMPEPDRSLLLRQARLLSAATKGGGSRQGLGQVGALEVLWRLGTILNVADPVEKK